MMIIIQVLLGIFILGILVLIHELGHFVAAKAFGIRVISFSIGFGKVLLKKTIGTTEYRLSIIPCGGYVHMAGEHPSDDRNSADDEFYAKPAWQRAGVAIAGPFANVISSIFFLWLVHILGTPHDKYLDSPVVGAVLDSSIAATNGFKAGDSIVSVNNEPVSSWVEIQNIFSKQDINYSILLYREGQPQTLTFSIPVNNNALPSDPTAGMLPALPAIIGRVEENSAAQNAGFLPYDTILSINDTKIISWFQVSNLISRFDSTNQFLLLTIKRNQSTYVLKARPTFETSEKRFILGIASAKPAETIIKYSASTSFRKALDKSWEYTTMIFDVLQKIISKTVSPKQLAGPVGMIQMSGVIALGSFVVLLNFMALIGINLAVINLFPLIITDGGVLLFILFEVVRRKPLSIKTQTLLNRVAIVFFIMLFLFVTFNDIVRIPLFLKMGGH